MSKCILHGHSPIERAGVGEFEGRTFMICAECGNTLCEVKTIMQIGPNEDMISFDACPQLPNTAFQQGYQRNG